MPSRNPMLVEVTRGPIVESTHQVMVDIVDAHGKQINSWGNINYLTVPRSAIKMLQALPILESGAADKFGLSEKHLCLACASHHAQKEHLTALKEWFEKVPLKESQLACGPHAPVNQAAAHDLIRRNAAPTPIMNNCSGKHAGILTTCVHLGEKTENYEKFDHPAQKRLRKVLTETMKVDHDKLPHGIDGCSMPTYAVPLQNLAIGMSTMINPSETEVRRTAAKRILQAIIHEPIYISGTEDFTAVVNQKTSGRSILKAGAEGVFSGLIPGKGIAFALKAADGSKRAAEFVAAQILRSYGGLTDAEYNEMKAFTQPTLTNWAGTEVGKIRLARES